jgi:hypothetical protein
MGALAKWLGELLTPIIIGAVKEAFKQMQDTVEVGKKNEQLQKDWDETQK